MPKDPPPADRAYQAALHEIERVRAVSGVELSLDREDCYELDRLPHEVRLIDGLRSLNLGRSKVSNLSPLRGMTALQVLSLHLSAVDDLSPLQGLAGLQDIRLHQTAVADLSPLQGLIGLRTIILNQTAVADLTPLQGLTSLQELWFSQTAVADLSPLQGLTKLETLVFNETTVADLSPLRNLTGLQMLSFDQTAIADLWPVHGLAGLTFLSLNQTAVADISPLQELSGLERLWFNRTAVADLSPLRGMVGLQALSFDQSAVIDLRPISDLSGLVESKKPVGGLWAGISFADTPATRSDPELARLAAIDYHSDRTTPTLAYLRSLPPWPEPLPWLVAKSAEDLTDSPVEPPLTVTAIIEAQDLAGWRFSPAQGALELFIRDEPPAARQQVLAAMTAERADKLIASLGSRINAGGVRQDTHYEALRFQAILADDSRSLALRSLELWGSLVALGALYEAHQSATREGRDPLDLLPVEAGAAMDTFLGVASGLVRSFPEARALDDEHATFTRRHVTRETVLALLQDALRTRFVEPGSVALMQHVAQVAEGLGKQAEKSTTVTMAGIRNMLLVAGVLGTTVGGVVAGITSDVGSDVSNHYELGEKANRFLDATRDKIADFIDALPADDRARVKAALEQVQRSGGP